MLTLIRMELLKIFKKWRTYIGFLAIAILIPIIQIATYFEGSGYLNMALQGLKQQFFFVGNLLNGYFLGNMLLNSLFVHIPFLIVLVAGDLLAGEATAGTYRIILTRPVSRFQLINAKFIAGILYTVSLLLWMALLSLGLSLVIFGSGELVVIRQKIIILAANDVLWRFALAYLYAILSMSTVMALAFLFSSLVENSIGPIIGALAVIIIFMIISVLPIHSLEAVKPFLFTNHLDKWMEFFGDPVDYPQIFKSAFVLLLHIGGFYVITLKIFTGKDILS